MYLNTEVKTGIFKTLGFAQKAEDTGSVESQVALFTHRINHLNQHLNSNPKDYSTRLGLLKLVGKRRNLLDYLYKKDIMRYRALIAKLEIRK